MINAQTSKEVLVASLSQQVMVEQVLAEQLMAELALPGPAERCR